LADRLSVRPGDEITVGLDTRFRDRSTPTTVAGTYAVGADGRTPKDPPGTHRWTYRRASLPVDSEFGVLPANLLVTDVAGAAALARPIGDELLYAVESQLDPATPTLAEARQTVDGIRDLQVEVRDPTLAGERPDRLRQQVVSGLPKLVAEAERVAIRTVAWTRPLLLAGLLLGLTAVGCVAVLTANRRAVEVRLGVAFGQRPSAAGGLAVLEVLPAAVLSVLLGPLVAWLAVRWVGPPAGVSMTALGQGTGRAALAAGVGCVLVAGVAVVAAWRAERLRVGSARSSVPWDVALALVAATATVGLLVRPDVSGPPSALDLLVPLLLVGAVGAVVGRAALTLLDGVAGRARSVSSMLALNRASAGRRQGALVVTVLAAGLGMLAYALAAAESVTTVTQDRTAVLAGANATADVEASWLLDPGAAQQPPPQPGDPAQPSLNAVPGSRTPPLPDGTTIVWRGRVSVPPELGNLDLLVIDPAHFEQVATWGTGPELARAREQVRRLASADAVVAEQLRKGERYGPVPAIGVGDVVSAPGETAGVTSEQGDVPVRFLDVVPAFPGHDDDLGMVVVPADSFFLYLGALDPRVAPPKGSGRFNRAPSDYFPSLWSADGVAGIGAVADPAGVKIDSTTTFAQVAQEPDLVAARRSTGAQVALGASVALVALLVLVMYAERRAAVARAADLMLARMGLRRRGVLRARAVELAVLTLLGALGAALGAALLAPLGGRLLDPGGGAEPEFHLRLDVVGALWVLAVAVLAWLSAVAVIAWRGRRVDEGQVLRDAE
jgi:putative ABC transport system permease protein